MKKFLCIMLFLALLSTQVASQNLIRVEEFEEYLELFEIDMEVWVDESAQTIELSDYSSSNFNDVLFQLGVLLRVIDFMFEDFEINFEDSKIKELTYSYFYDEGLNFNIVMTEDWLKEYFSSKRNQKDELVYSLFYSYYKLWEKELIEVESKVQQKVLSF